MRKILIVGATSAIAEATARYFAERGDHLYLAGRNSELLESVKTDLRIRGASSVNGESFDAAQPGNLEEMVERACAAMGGLDTALIAHGTLPDQEACQGSVGQTLEQLQVNALSVIALLTLLANRFEAQRHGTLAVISSVAGDRGRSSNYVYGAAKAAVSTFMSGLRQRLRPCGVRVLTVKPGFVDTPMTRNFAKGPLWSSPDRIARGIVNAIDHDKQIVYLPWFWWWIMAVIRALPEWLFTRIRL